METVLTAVVSRLLKKFIKHNANGESGEDLRVRLSNGRVLLHNLELDLSTLFAPSSSVAVSRAFAKELSVDIPWTSLGSEAIDICLDTVEVVLDVADDDDGLAAATAAAGEEGQRQRQRPPAPTTQPLEEQDGERGTGTAGRPAAGPEGTAAAPSSSSALREGRRAGSTCPSGRAGSCPPPPRQWPTRCCS